VPVNPAEPPLQYVGVTNKGTEPVFIEEDPILGDASFTIAPTFTLPREIASGATVGVPIIFNPTTPGVQTGYLRIVDADGTTVKVVDLRGEGTPPPP
jgi:hypothetical protein